MNATAQLDEIWRVSRYPKLKAILPAQRVGAMVINMQCAILLDALPALPDGMDTSDPNDAFPARMALASQADFLVTGDRRAGLLQPGHTCRTRIINPATFCSEVL